MTSVDILLLGVFHMANPRADMVNLDVDDILSPARQSEVEACAAALASFQPTKVLVEHPAGDTAVLEAYTAFRLDQRGLSRSETVQLGFRIAVTCGHDRIYPIDVVDRFYEPRIEELTGTEPHASRWQALLTASEAAVDRQQRVLENGTVADALRLLNHPDEKAAALAPYLESLLPISEAGSSPGPDMVANWYRRNFRIAANVHALAQPGDRLLIIYGAGHIPVLEHILGATSHFTLVNTLDYLASA